MSTDFSGFHGFCSQFSPTKSPTWQRAFFVGLNHAQQTSISAVHRIREVR